jgi:hypothetical protein
MIRNVCCNAGLTFSGVVKSAVVMLDLLIADVCSATYLSDDMTSISLRNSSSF